MNSYNIHRKRGKGRKEDEESSEITNKKDKRHSLASHVLARFVRLIRLSAILQRISEATGIPRSMLICGGPSTHQDTSESSGRSVHAAHIIQAQLYPFLRKIIGEQMYNELLSLLEHTQSQPAANNNSRLGRAIDEAQRESINGDLNSIDFSLGPNNSTNISIVREIQNAFLERLIMAQLSERMNRSNSSQDRLDDLSVAINTIRHVDIRDTLARAQRAYENETTIAEDGADFDFKTDKSDGQNQSTGGSNRQNQSTGGSYRQNQSTGKTGGSNKQNQSTSESNRQSQSTSQTGGSNGQIQSSFGHAVLSEYMSSTILDKIGPVNVEILKRTIPISIPNGNRIGISDVIISSQLPKAAILFATGAATTTATASVAPILATGLKPLITPGACSIM